MTRSTKSSPQPGEIMVETYEDRDDAEEEADRLRAIDLGHVYIVRETGKRRVSDEMTLREAILWKRAK